MKQITAYFKNALSAQKNPTIDFKKGTFAIERTLTNIENGIVDSSTVQKLFQNEKNLH